MKPKRSSGSMTPLCWDNRWKICVSVMSPAHDRARCIEWLTREHCKESLTPAVRHVSERLRTSMHLLRPLVCVHKTPCVALPDINRPCVFSTHLCGRSPSMSTLSSCSRLGAGSPWHYVAIGLPRLLWRQPLSWPPVDTSSNAIRWMLFLLL